MKIDYNYSYRISNGRPINNKFKLELDNEDEMTSIINSYCIEEYNIYTNPLPYYMQHRNVVYKNQNESYLKHYSKRLSYSIKNYCTWKNFRDQYLNMLFFIMIKILFNSYCADGFFKILHNFKLRIYKLLRIKSN